MLFGVGTSCRYLNQP